MTHRFSFLNYAALNLTLCILLFHVLELCKYESFSMPFLYFMVLVNRLQGQLTPIFSTYQYNWYSNLEFMYVCPPIAYDM